METELSTGVVHIIKEPQADLSFTLFENLTDEPIPRLVLTRQFPDNLRQRWPLRGARIYWLSRTRGDHHLDPTDIPAIATILRTFLEEEGTKALLLDGFEYLVTANGFDQALRLLDFLQKNAHSSATVIIVSLSPRALHPEERSRIDRAFDVIVSPEALLALPEIEAPSV